MNSKCIALAQATHSQPAGRMEEEGARRASSGWASAMKAVLWFPVVFVMGVLIYCYYAYIVTFCSISLRSTVLINII